MAKTISVKQRSLEITLLTIVHGYDPSYRNCEPRTLFNNEILIKKNVGIEPGDIVQFEFNEKTDRSSIPITTVIFYDCVDYDDFSHLLVRQSAIIQTDKKTF